MSKRMRLAAAFVAVLGSALAVFAPAQAQAPGVIIGTLSCSVASGFGFIFGSSRAINCTFAAPGGRYEHYVGNISKFGVDIGYTQGGVIIWTVVSPTAALVPGALAGNYVGGTASATVGVGVGANALIGGFNNQITLQPLSIEANRGLNVAAGIGAISLSAAP
jgi:uncharacterized protein DUF992